MSNFYPGLPNQLPRVATWAAVVGSTLVAACGGGSGESGNPVAARTVTVTRTVMVPETVPLDGGATTTTPKTTTAPKTGTTPAPPAETTPHTTTTPAAPAPKNRVTTTPSTPNTSTPAPTPNAPTAPAPAPNPGAEASPKKPAANPCAPTDPNVPERARTVVALDPGHGPSSTTIDSKTGLKQIEAPNAPEVTEVWTVANRVRCSLQKDGYKVVMLKKNVDEKITFRQRAERADAANADIAVSIHDDKTLPNTGQIYPQKVGLYRGKGPNKTTFTNKTVAETSQKYAQIFQRERQKVEGKDVIVTTANFDNRPGFEPGTIPFVQLFTKKVPWVYNEKQKPLVLANYSFSLVKAIEACLLPTRTQVQTKQSKQ